MSAVDTHPQSIPMPTYHSVAEQVSGRVATFRVPLELLTEELDPRVCAAPRPARVRARRLAVRP
jgi:hypothetical protein